MPRQKQVFSSNSQVAHIWAQQTQSMGRSKSVFFENESIYSYGRHYKAARIHVLKSKRFALINNHRYSNTTGRHLSEIARAVYGLMPYFSCPDVNDPKSAVRWLDEQASGTLNLALRRQKITTEREIKYELEDIQKNFAHANELRALLGLKPKEPGKNQLTAVTTHLKARLKRYRELNTPEMIVKSLEQAEKRKALKAKKLAEKHQELVARFRAGERVESFFHEHELLRIKGDVVQTSRGAEVPLKEALKLYKAVKAGKNIVNCEVGHFVVNNVNETSQTDIEIRIGCHTILFSEAAHVLDKALPNLKLVKAS